MLKQEKKGLGSDMIACFEFLLDLSKLQLQLTGPAH